MLTQKFWSTQPVTQSLQQLRYIETDIEIESNKTDIKQIPYQLPTDFYWYNLNIEDDQDLDNLHVLLQNNYVEDSGQEFRLNYSKEFLRWALMAPNYKKDWHLVVRNIKGKSPFLAFISAIPVTVMLSSVAYNMVEINFLCIHKKLRGLRLAPVLIREITRRGNSSGIFQAIYTAGNKLSVPIVSATYHHRPLNIKKLLDVNFMTLRSNMTISCTIKINKLDKI